MFFSPAFNVDKDVIKINNNKDIEFFCQEFFDIALEGGQYIGQSKKYYLLLKVAITGLKNHLLFIIFFNPHLMISIG